MTAGTHQGRLAVLGLVFVPTLMFLDVLVGRTTFFDRDIGLWWYPQATAFAAVIRDGRWPLWDAYKGFGMPMLADPSTQVLYPPTWLVLVLPLPAAYALLVLGHLMGTAVGMYRVALRLGIAAPAAFVAAAVWCTSGPLLSTVSMTQHLCGAAWIPWVLLALDRLWERPVLSRAVVLAATAALQGLAGSGEMCLVTVLAAPVVVWPHALRAQGRVRGAVAASFGALVLAAALTAVQWLPTAALLRSAALSGLPARARLVWSAHPLNLLDLLVPRLWADLPLNDAWRAWILGGREPFLASLYLGAAASCFVLAGTGRRFWICLAGCIAFALLAAGDSGPFESVLLAVPPFSYFRYPMKYAVGIAFCWSLAAGLGYDGWRLADRAERRHRPAWVGMVLAVAFVVTGLLVGARPGVLASVVASSATEAVALVPYVALDLSRKLFLCAIGPAAVALLVAGGHMARVATARLQPGVLAILVAEGILWGRTANLLLPSEIAQTRPPLVGGLDSAPGSRRVFAVPEPLEWLNREVARGPAGWPMAASWCLGLQERLTPRSPGRWGIQGSYDGDVNGLDTPAQSAVSSLTARAWPSALGLRLLQMGGVDHVVGLDASVLASLPVVASYPSVFAHPILVRRVPDPLPDAYLVAGTARARDALDLDALRRGSFDPRRTVLLEEGEERDPPEGFEGHVDALATHADLLLFRTAASQRAWLVVLGAHRPGWRAWVDGQPVQVERANLLFRAVAVPAGIHEVKLSYEVPGLRIGMTLTAAGATIALLGLIPWRRTNRMTADRA